MQLRYFRKQREQSAAATARKKAMNTKRLPSWARHDIWQDEPKEAKEASALLTGAQADTQKPVTQRTAQKTSPTHTPTQSTTQDTSQTTTPNATTQPEEDKKSRFKFW